MQATSCVRPGYMSSQGDINEKMRAILIDWLIEVEKLENPRPSLSYRLYLFETVYLGLIIYYISLDRFITSLS